jgi:hypothetical protein
MKCKKIITGVLSVTMLTLPAVTVLGSDADAISDVIPISAPLEEIIQARYESITGTVVGIRDHGEEGSKFISIGSEDEVTANIIVSKDTYIVDDAEIAVGSVVTWFFDASKPMIMIYPAQYHPEVVAVEKDGQNLKLDIFDEDLVSSDSNLKLNISGETRIVSPDESPFGGEPAGKKLLVIYGASTRSIPAQTNPEKIVVFPDEEEVPSDVVVEEEDQAVSIDVSAMDIVVNDRKIDAPAAYNDEQGTVMVPLRAVAEALGFDVKWDNKLQSVMVGKAISLKIGEDNYLYAKTAPIKLGTAPALVNGTTFVPLSFFKEVAKVSNAYVFEGQIDINDGELMH